MVSFIPVLPSFLKFHPRVEIGIFLRLHNEFNLEPFNLVWLTYPPTAVLIFDWTHSRPQSHDHSDLRQGSGALAGPDFLSMRRVFVSYSQPIRFARFDGKSVNRGLPVLDKARALDSCRRSDWSWALGTRMYWTYKHRVLSSAWAKIRFLLHKIFSPFAHPKFQHWLKRSPVVVDIKEHSFPLPRKISVPDRIPHAPQIGWNFSPGCNS